MKKRKKTENREQIMENRVRGTENSEKGALEEAQEVTRQEGVFRGFMEFLKQYSIIGLAIGLVIGNASQTLVKALVEGIITPFIGVILGLFLPKLGSLVDFKIHLQNQDFKVGQVIQNTIEFLIILFLIYVVIKVLLKRDDLIEKKK